MDYQLWVIAREAEREYREASAETIDLWLARETAQEAYDEADRELQIAQDVEAAKLEEWQAARDRAEYAYAAACEHDQALGA